MPNSKVHKQNQKLLGEIFDAFDDLPNDVADELQNTCLGEILSAWIAYLDGMCVACPECGSESGCNIDCPECMCERFNQDANV